MGTSAPPWVVLETETSEFFVIASPRAAELFFGEFSDDVPSDFRVFDSEGWELEFERDARGTIDQKRCMAVRDLDSRPCRSGECGGGVHVALREG